MQKIKVINKVGLYIVPLLKIPLKYFNLLDNVYYDPYCDVCVLKFTKQDNEDTISLLTTSFIEYESVLESNENYIRTLDLQDSILFLFKAPIDKEETIRYILTGKYSCISDENKQLVIKYATTFFNLKIAAKLEAILYRKEWLIKELETSLDMKLPKESELSSVIFNEEYIDISTLTDIDTGLCIKN